ncbi:YkyA family protein [Geomicrobium sp. JCM 19039]|uniref:YkyA family protein n=1 Tax=Geomicrobium sp. JCM 19039 TaxID=1460636 RepID=UPI0005AB16B5|nr:YkyA family protein [Geomicrobium sp. JCM 19039]
MRRLLYVGPFVLGTLLLAGCMESAEEELMINIEDAIELENEFEEQQTPLIEAEEQEYELFEEMVNLGLQDMDEIEGLVAQASELANERISRMETERESIVTAYETFMEEESLLDDLEGSLREDAEAVFDAMEQRYQVHTELYEGYTEAVQMDLDLYEMFLDEELSFEELEGQINLVNEQYQSVNEYKEQFNDYTTTFNEQKEQFYDTADFVIEAEE